MAVRKFFLNIGQSNGSPYPDALTWFLLHPSLDIRTTNVGLFAPNAAKGSYSDTHAFPSNVFPSYGTVNVKGKAISAVKYLTFYNPQSTGYSDYPNTFRLSEVVSTSSWKTEQFWISSLVGETVTRVRTGTTHAISGHTNVNAANQVLSIAGAFSPALELGETFTFVHTATAGGTVSAFTHKLRYGQDWQSNGTYQASLEGCWVKCLTAVNAPNVNQRRQIASVTGLSNETINLVTGFPQNTNVGDTFVIEPPTGVDWKEWSYWLPWSPFEGNVVANKTNPYPPGFNYPANYDYEPPFNPFSGATRLWAGSFERISYHVGLAVRLHEFFGETVYGITLSPEATSLGHNELGLASPSGQVYSAGWFDFAQQNYWAAGESNGLYARLMDVLDAAKDAATLDGDTLECVGVFFIQGESDATNSIWADSYRENLQAFKAGVRQAIVTKGLYSGAASTIPWCQPKISMVIGWAYGDQVNAAIAAEADADRYMRTGEVAGFFLLPDNTHYSGIGATQLEELLFDAWKLARQGFVQDADAFSVEDGVGTSSGTENSYCTQDFAGVYFQNQGGIAAWNTATEQQRSEALMQATTWIDQNYGTRFVGLRSTSAQPLEWPRAFAYDRDGYEISGIPPALKKATAEMARRWLEDKTQFQPDIAAGSNVTQDTVTVGPITISKTYGGGKDSEKRFKVVDRLFQVAGLIDSGGWAKR